MNILTVDDEVIQVETLKRGLRSRGHQVMHALNAHEALDHLQARASEIQLVITDYAMPVMNGMELLRNIRTQFGELPVIMMTAYGGKDLVIDALRDRCDGFIEKPFTLDQLMEEIERVTKGRDASAHPHSHENLQSTRMLVHEANNYLYAILGSAELARLSLNDVKTVDKCLDRIITSAEMISRINQQIKEGGR